MKKIIVALEGQLLPEELHEMLRQQFSPRYSINRTDWQTAVDFAVRSNRWVIARLQVRQWGGRTEATIEDDVTANEGILRFGGAILYLLPFLILMPLFIYLDQVFVYSYMLLLVAVLFFLFRFLIVFRRMALKREIADFLKEEVPQ